jgi:CcmD family protein
MKKMRPLPNPSLPRSSGLQAKQRGLTAIQKILPFILSLLLSMSAIAQGDQSSPGLMRSHLKMYVVVTVLVIIFLGIVIFLLSLDRRLKKLEGMES